MPYVSKFRRAGGTVIALYTCPKHGVFELEVQRDENGEAPDRVLCMEPGDPIDFRVPASDTMPGFHCARVATWTPSATVGCRVRRVEVTRGKWEKPERPTYLDTRKLGEGQSMEEFQAERKKVWQRKREAEVMAIKKGFI